MWIVCLLIFFESEITNANLQIQADTLLICDKYYHFEKDENINLNVTSTETIIDSLDKYSVYYPPYVADNTRITDNYFSGEFFGLCYVRFTNFLEETDTKFEKSLADFKRSNCKTLILDLSFCDGGDLDCAINIAKQLVPKGKICEIEFKNETKTYYSELDKCPFENIIIITSPQTASASEILISALKESDCAFAVGTNTYGKTAVQRNFALSDGGVLKLTVGKYYTRNGNDVEGVGVEPDINIAHCFLVAVCLVLVYKTMKFNRKIKFGSSVNSDMGLE